MREDIALFTDEKTCLNQKVLEEMTNENIVRLRKQ